MSTGVPRWWCPMKEYSRRARTALPSSSTRDGRRGGEAGCRKKWTGRHMTGPRRGRTVQAAKTWTVAAARGAAGVRACLVVRLGGLADNCAMDEIWWVPTQVCCTLLMKGPGEGFPWVEGQKRRAGSGRRELLELEMAAHYDIPTTPRNGASM